MAKPFKPGQFTIGHRPSPPDLTRAKTEFSEEEREAREAAPVLTQSTHGNGAEEASSPAEPCPLGQAPQGAWA
eukprot:7184443-Heterocapsa_arctica.AAC.1